VFLEYFANTIGSEVMSQIPKGNDYYEPIMKVMDNHIMKKKITIAFVLVKKYNFNFNQVFILRYVMDFLDLYGSLTDC